MITRNCIFVDVFVIRRISSAVVNITYALTISVVRSENSAAPSAAGIFITPILSVIIFLRHIYRFVHLVYWYGTESEC